MVTAMVALCGLAIGVMAVPDGGRRLLRGLARAVICMVAAYGLNTALPADWALGINAVTAAVGGALGLPGLAAMYVLRIIS